RDGRPGPGPTASPETGAWSGTPGRTTSVTAGKRLRKVTPPETTAEVHASPGKPASGNPLLLPPKPKDPVPWFIDVRSLRRGTARTRARHQPEAPYPGTCPFDRRFWPRRQPQGTPPRVRTVGPELAGAVPRWRLPHPDQGRSDPAARGKSSVPL